MTARVETTDTASSDARSIGVDWANGSWIAVHYEGADYDRTTDHEHIEELWTEYGVDALQVGIDIPIGLPSERHPERRVESLARAVVGDRYPSVFNPPARAVLDLDDYETANERNRAITGKGLSRQAFHLREGIRQVDDLLREREDAREIVFEAHPEVCFRAFSRAPLTHPKSRAAGVAERLEVLASYEADAPATVRAAAADSAGSGADFDDVIDAVVVALTARPADVSMWTIPEHPSRDDEGLPMQMVYRGNERLAGAG